jgi:hypothetical protein
MASNGLIARAIVFMGIPQEWLRLIRANPASIAAPECSVTTGRIFAPDTKCLLFVRRALFAQFVPIFIIIVFQRVIRLMHNDGAFACAINAHLTKSAH